MLQQHHTTAVLVLHRPGRPLESAGPPAMMTRVADIPDALWYFAYGSNMSPAIFLERREMHPRLTRRGRLDGYRLRFTLPVGPGERGVANLEADQAAQVWGVLYLLAGEEFDRLDRTEGVDRGFYQRIRVDVLADGAEPVIAFTYLSRFSMAGRKPSPRYIGLLLEGARRHGLPGDYVSSLEALELAVDERLARDDVKRGPL
jgi:cation transport regulator ChaC